MYFGISENNILLLFRDSRFVDVNILKKNFPIILKLQQSSDSNILGTNIDKVFHVT